LLVSECQLTLLRNYFIMQTERQVQIIEVAMKLIADKGIQGFTIKNLSKEIGVSKPAIYRHFKSKTDILINILNSFKEMSEMMSEMLVNKTDSIPIK
jgi:AcrR family transcriptional regulator